MDGAVLYQVDLTDPSLVSTNAAQISGGSKAGGRPVSQNRSRTSSPRWLSLVCCVCAELLLGAEYFMV